MNILIPHKWLLEHLETKATPNQIQEYLSLCGPSVERIYDIEGDKVYDIEVTTNRVDSMSVRGIAREAAVILNQFDIPAKLKPLQLTKVELPKKDTLTLPKINNDANLNNRTMCVILTGVKRNPTPDWMAKRLIQTEMSVHDAVIDITNYVTHELGHPCHAFDYDKLMKTGGEINIVEAQPGETFTTLDEESFETVGGEVVFKNGQGEIIDLPSIKGTQNTSIDETTQNVLLLMESIRADKVRFASMTHAIRTTAAQLMEKNVDPNLMDPTMDMGIKLYQDLCGAEAASHIFDQRTDKQQTKTVSITHQKIENYLGISIEQRTVKEILENLECKVEIKNDTSYLVYPPTFRPDLNIPADIVEEIARIYGYHNLPSVLMPTAIPTEKPTTTDFHMENKIKHFLADIGWQEVYTYSMVSQQIAEESGYPIEDHLKIKNELTEDRVYMRRSLIPSLEEVIDQNPLRQNLSVFEIANLYHPKHNDIPNNETHLSMVSTKPYRQIKGEVEALLDQFFVKNVEFKVIENKSALFVQQAEIHAQNKQGKQIRIGKIGILQSGHVAIGIALLQLIKVVHSYPTYQPIPKTSIITEELTFTLPDKTEIGKVINLAKTVDTKVSQVTMEGDLYKNNGTISVSYYDPTQNLSSEDIKPIREKLVAQITQKFNAKLVGKI